MAYKWEWQQARGSVVSLWRSGSDAYLSAWQALGRTLNLNSGAQCDAVNMWRWSRCGAWGWNDRTLRRKWSRHAKRVAQAQGVSR